MSQEHEELEDDIDGAWGRWCSPLEEVLIAAEALSLYSPNGRRSDYQFNTMVSLMLRTILPDLRDDLLLTPREVALIISPEWPSVIFVRQEEKLGHLIGRRGRKHTWYTAGAVREYLRQYGSGNAAT